MGNIKGLDKINMPRVGDVMIYKKDTTLGQTGEFDANIQTLDIPGEIKLGYSPIGFVRCGRAACRATAFKNCEGLSRIAFLDGNTVVMLGKVVSTIAKADLPAEDPKKKAKRGAPLLAGTPCGAAADAPHQWHEEAPSMLLEVLGQLQAARLSTVRVARPVRVCISSWLCRRHPFTKESYRIRAPCA